MGFAVKQIHKKKEPHALHYLYERTSFWVAVLSLIAFVTGNMMGQHGWYAFWKSVLGRGDDSLIVYTGTVTPVESVPDYECWGEYGGDASMHTYRQVPEQCLRTLPRYSSSWQRRTDVDHGYGNDVYSVGHLGSYNRGVEGEGSHAGIDIRMPEGTPVRSIGNAIVVTAENITGFGKTVVLRHPNVPDPSDHTKTTTLYSSYAHLSAIFVTEGSIIQKGEHIADSGQTGNVSGPHLHFQLDREEAERFPYWLFTGAEARDEGMTVSQAVDAGLFQSRGYLYSVNPMLYVQANYEPVRLVARSDSNNDIIVEEVTVHTEEPKDEKRNLLTSMLERKTKRLAQMLLRRDERLQQRLARSGTSEPFHAAAPSQPIVNSQEVASADENIVENLGPKPVASVLIRHDGEFHDGEEQIIIVLVDADGNTVTDPLLPSELHMKTAYGEAKFIPSSLTVRNFRNGEAQVRMIPKGKRTIVIQAHPFNDYLSRAMVFD